MRPFPFVANKHRRKYKEIQTTSQFLLYQNRYLNLLAVARNLRLFMSGNQSRTSSSEPQVTLRKDVKVNEDIQTPDNKTYKCPTCCEMGNVGGDHQCRKAKEIQPKEIQPKEILLVDVDEIGFKGVHEGPVPVPNANDAVGTWISVNKEVEFIENSVTKMFIGKILLKNFSSVFITYKVIPSNCSMFTFTPRPFGAIGPKKTAEVIVMSCKKVETKDYLKASRIFFHILSVPFYYHSQVNEKRIQAYWDALGTPMLPSDCIDELTSSVLLPPKEDWLSEFSVAGRGFFGKFLRSNPRPISIFENKKMKRAKDFNFRLVKAWMPEDVGKNPLPYMKHQLRVTEAYMARIESHLESMAYSFRLYIAALLGIIMCFIVVYCFGQPLVKNFGPNGVWVEDAIKQNADEKIFDDQDQETWNWWPFPSFGLGGFGSNGTATN